MEDNGVHFPESNNADRPMLFPQSRNAVLAADQPSAPGAAIHRSAYCDELRVLSFRGPPAQGSVAKTGGGRKELTAIDKVWTRRSGSRGQFPLRRGYQAGAKTSCHLSPAEAAGQSQRGITVGQVWHIPGSTLVGLSACPKKAWRPLSTVERGRGRLGSGVTASVDMLAAR